ncbi:MAG: Mrp/NBP35 family ATP-binding protein [Thermodesulfobacteriota bacterium]|nr:Mrp/NBP35 family ATP-binding protein [Thermodesulfobacteriota bacterium]
MIDEQKVRESLQSVREPKLKKNLVELGMIKNVTVEAEKVTLTLALPTLKYPLKGRIVDEIKLVLAGFPGVSSVDVQITALSADERERLFPKPSLPGIQKVSRFLAVASGKGGVGKTTIAVNVALALVKHGHKVGLLDADVYGPSIPLMLGLSGKAEMKHGMFIPVEKFGLKIMSFGMLMVEGQAVIWRGPLVARAIKQLLGEVMWGELDYLVVDLPPGTGDPSISIAQALPKMQVLMVTTPQEVALADVRRSISLFTKYNRTVLGLIENMSYFQCAHSSEQIKIFGHGGGKTLSRETGLPLLGGIPIDPGISQGGDSGVPLMISSPNSDTARIFLVP